MAEEESIEEETSFKPKGNRWILIAIGLLVVLGVAGGVWLGTRKTTEPLRVLVAVEFDGYFWEGSRAASRLVDQVVPQLKKVGFLPVEGGDLEMVQKLEGAATAEEAAARVGAAFIVTGKLKLEVIEHPYRGGYFEVRAAGPLELAQLGGNKREIGTIQSWSGGPKKEDALGLLADGLGLQTFDRVLPALMNHEAIVAIAKGSDKIAAAKLTAAKSYVERVQSNLKAATDNYDGLIKKLVDEDKSPSKITLHGKLDQRENLSSVGAAGFLAMSSKVRPFLSPINGELGYFEDLEKLYWKGLDGTPRVVVESYNITGYPSSPPEGGVVVFVEDLFGLAKAVSVVSGTAPPKRVLVDEKRSFSEPKVAPGGRFAALWARDCPRCPSALLVIELSSGKQLYTSDPKTGSLGGFAWLGPSELGYLLRDAQPSAGAEPTQPIPQALHALDFGLAPPKDSVLHTFKAEEALSMPSTDGSGKKISFRRASNDESSLSLFDRDAKKYQIFEIGGAYDPSLSPAGDKITYVSGGDALVFDIPSGNTTPLTSASLEIRYPQFSLDGKRVFFEVRAKDPNYPKERAVSAVASVPVP
jgi:TolB protein